jgi:hypothetical protein
MSMRVSAVGIGGKSKYNKRLWLREIVWTGGDAGGRAIGVKIRLVPKMTPLGSCGLVAVPAHSGLFGEWIPDASGVYREIPYLNW